jgi:hypothetical protein
MKTLITTLLIFASQVSHAWTLNSQYPEQRGWAQRPLVFHVNRTNCPDDLDVYLDQAVELWNSVPGSSLKVEIGSDTTNTIAQLWAGSATDVPMIACDPNFSATASVDGDSIPGVGFLRGSSLNPVKNGGLLLNVETTKNADINKLSDTLVAVVVAHEIGHVLGIGHTSDKSALMYYDATAKKNLALSQDDRDAVSFLYPRNEISNLDLIGGCGAIHSLANGSGPGSSPWGGNSLGLISALYLAYWALQQFRRRQRPLAISGS